LFAQGIEHHVIRHSKRRLTAKPQERIQPVHGKRHDAGRRKSVERPLQAAMSEYKNLVRSFFLRAAAYD
jgi:hypothetical protein